MTMSMFIDVCRTIVPRVARTGASAAKMGAMVAVSFLPSSTASLKYKPLGAAIEALAREHVSTELKWRLLEEKQCHPSAHAVPLSAEADLRNELGQMMDDKWEDKKRVILNEVNKKINQEAEKRAREAQVQRVKDNLPDILRRIAELECQVKAQADKSAAEPSSNPGSFGRRYKMIDKAQEAGPSKDQFDKLSEKVDTAMVGHAAMRNDIEATKQGLSDVQGRLKLFETSSLANQASVTNSGAVSTPTTAAEQRQSDPCSCNREEMSALKTKIDDFCKRLESLETVQTHLDLKKMWDFCVWATTKFEEYDEVLSKTANKGTVSNGVATPTTGAEQPRADARSCDHKEIGALMSKTKDHSERLDSLESLQTQLKDMWDFCVFGTEKFKDGDSHFNEIATKIKEIQRTIEKQDTLFHETMNKQKESSDKEINGLKESIKEQMKPSEASVDKAKEEAEAAAKYKQIEELKADNEKLVKEKAALAKQIEAQDKKIIAQGKRLDAQDKQLTDLNAGQKVQDGAIAELQKTVTYMYAFLSHQNGGQQSPTPAQQQPQPSQPHPAPGPQANGPWTPAPSPPDQGHEMGMDMGGADGDSEMTDAPRQPAQPHQPRAHQVPNFSEQPQQPPRRPVHQPPQPSTTTPQDTPMANSGPIVPKSNGNAADMGNIGAARQPQRVGGSPTFLGNGPTRPSPNPSSTFGARPSRQNLSSVPQSPVISGSGPSKPTPAQAAAAGNAKAPSPAKFDFNVLPPPVKMPQIDWGMGAMNVATPPKPANQPPAPMPKMPLANAAPVASSTGQPAAKMASPGNSGPSSSAHPNGPSSSNAPAPAMANNGGPSSSTEGSHSTPAKPTTKPAQKKPNLFNKQGKPMLTPNKPPSVTSKAQTTQTAAAKLAAQRQAAFAAQFSSASPQTTSPAPVARTAPMNRTGGESEFFIPGLTGAPNTSPFALQPKTPASMPKTPTSNPYGSPSLNKSRTHDTVEANTPINIFVKEVVEVPEVNAGDEMSGLETKPETNEATQPESNPVKHAHEPERNPRKHINSEDAPVVQQQEDAMGTDRQTLKPKGRGQKMTAEQIKAHKDRFNEEEAWAAFDRAQNKPKTKDPDTSDEDVVDYADPNDINDEDLHNTVARSPKQSIRPTKYSIDYYLNWKKHFLRREVLKSLEFQKKEEIKEFFDALTEMDKANPLADLLTEAGLPTLRGYSKYQMQCLMDAYRENVFFDAVRAISEEPPAEEDFEGLRHELTKARDKWFTAHREDVV